MTDKQTKKVAADNSNEVPAHAIQMAAIKKFPKFDSPGMLPPIKCMQLNTGEIIFCLMLEETEDSFLVGAGTRLTPNEDSTYTAYPISPIGVVRVIKNSVKFISEVASTYRYWYYKYLQSKGGGVKLLPDLIQGVVLEDVVAYTQEYDLERTPTPNQTSQPESNAPETLTEKYTKKGIVGVSEHAFEPFNSQLDVTVH